MTQGRLMLAKSIFFDIVSSLYAPIGGHEVVTRRTVPRKMRLQKSVHDTIFRTGRFCSLLFFFWGEQPI